MGVLDEAADTFATGDAYAATGEDHLEAAAVRTLKRAEPFTSWLARRCQTAHRNNAGVEKMVPLLAMSAADWDAVIRTNLTVSFLCLREAAKVMAKNSRGGVVVNTSSDHEFIPWPGFAHYCASKGGLKLLMETAARELAPKRIRVLNVAPGAIATPINRFVLDDPESLHAVESEIPWGRARPLRSPGPSHGWPATVASEM